MSDRFSVIHDKISEWQKQDTNLANREGFLLYLKACDIGQFSVGNTDRWMKCYKDAKKKGISVAEHLFESRKRLLNVKLRYEKDHSREQAQRIFVIDEEKTQLIKELEERLKTYDPARIKRQNK